tara:strand:+ start:1203 stop:1871 length:669 start_codon:yes stop_codon:yes gene_type:complete
MQLFLDTADVQQIEQRLSSGFISGVTTNPTLIKKSSRNPQDVYKELVDMGIPDISMEMVADNEADFFRYGVEHYRTYNEPCTIKLPCTVDGLKACKRLSDIQIRVNMTLVFSVSQAILCAMAGATYVSPFVGRLNDNSVDGIGLVGAISHLYNLKSIKTKVLAASLRDVQSVENSFGQGADICTVPVDVFDKMTDHVLTTAGIEKFNTDWDEATVKTVKTDN